MHVTLTRWSRFGGTLQELELSLAAHLRLPAHPRMSLHCNRRSDLVMTRAHREYYGYPVRRCYLGVDDPLFDRFAPSCTLDYGDVLRMSVADAPLAR